MHKSIFLIFYVLIFSLSTCFSIEDRQDEKDDDIEWILPGQEDDSLLPLREYEGEPSGPTSEEILYRAEKAPLNIFSSVIFILAVLHILSVRKISLLAKKIKPDTELKKFFIEILHFLGEVEIVFGIWVIPLVICITTFYNWETAVDYLNSRNYTEAIAVVVIMSIAASKPIVYIVEKIIGFIAHSFGNTLSAWWLSLMIIGPLLGAFITEAGAMILTAVLLTKKFYDMRPSPKLSYASLGLLFTNVSLGGIITVFASPPALLAAHAWKWDSFYMFFTFGFKAIIAIALSSFFYYWLFKDEFKGLEKSFSSANQSEETKFKNEPIPCFVFIGNLIFLFGVAYNVHLPVIFIGLYLFYLGFYQATSAFQGELHLRSALLVGFFIAGLVIHAGLQEWWIAPLFEHVDAFKMMGVSMILGPVTDNAALTYMATLIPDLSESAKYAVMVGAVSAGGLTVIANAPNPAGQQILNPYFKDGISSLNLFKGAFLPTLISILIFFLI